MIRPQETIAVQSVTTPQSSELEQTMLAEDKLFVVLAVVLVIWAGIILMLVRNDRKAAELERRLADGRKKRSKEG